MSVSDVMRVMVWKEMTAAQRTQLLGRGIGEIFSPTLKANIGKIIDDVREHGDEAVCRALRDFDHISVEPDRLRVTDEEDRKSVV